MVATKAGTRTTKPILAKDMNRCIVCGHYGAEWHHVFEGQANRQKSDRYGLIVPLCPLHHRDGKEGVHGQNSTLYKGIKKYAQIKAMKRYGWSAEEFIEIFGKSYL